MMMAAFLKRFPSKLVMEPATVAQGTSCTPNSTSRTSALRRTRIRRAPAASADPGNSGRVARHGALAARRVHRVRAHIVVARRQPGHAEAPLGVGTSAAERREPALPFDEMRPQRIDHGSRQRSAVFAEHASRDDRFARQPEVHAIALLPSASGIVPGVPMRRRYPSVLVTYAGADAVTV